MSTRDGSPEAVLGKSEYRLMIQHLWQVHQQEYERYYTRPDSHPKYHDEWITFISTRSQRVLELGADPKTYDYYSEWKGVWMSRLQELEVEEWNTKKEDSLKISSLHARSHREKHMPTKICDHHTQSTESSSSWEENRKVTRRRMYKISKTRKSWTPPRRQSQSGSDSSRLRSPIAKFRSRSPFRLISKGLRRSRSRSQCRTRPENSSLCSLSPIRKKERRSSQRSISPPIRKKSKSPKNVRSHSPAMKKSRSPKMCLQDKKTLRQSTSQARSSSSTPPRKLLEIKEDSGNFNSAQGVISSRSCLSSSSTSSSCSKGFKSRCRTVSTSGSEEQSGSKKHQHEHDEKSALSLKKKLNKSVKVSLKGKSKKPKSKSKKKHKKSSKKEKKKSSHETDGKEKKHKDDKTQEERGDDGEALKTGVNNLLEVSNEKLKKKNCAQQKCENDKVLHNSEPVIGLEGEASMRCDPKPQCNEIVNSSVDIEDKSSDTRSAMTKKDDNTESSTLKMKCEKYDDKNEDSATDVQGSSGKDMLHKHFKETFVAKTYNNDIKNERKSCNKTTTKGDRINELKKVSSLLTENISSAENSNDFRGKYLKRKKISTPEPVSKSFRKAVRYSRDRPISSTSNLSSRREDSAWERRRYWMDKRRDYDKLKRRDLGAGRGETKSRGYDELKLRINKRRDYDEFSIGKHSSHDRLKEENKYGFFKKHRGGDNSSYMKRMRNQENRYISKWRKDVRDRTWLEDEKSNSEGIIPCCSMESCKKRKSVVEPEIIDISSKSRESKSNEVTASQRSKLRKLKSALTEVGFSQFGRDTVSPVHDACISWENKESNPKLKLVSENSESSSSCISVFDKNKTVPVNLKASIKKSLDLSDIENISTSSIITWIESPVQKYGKDNPCSGSFIHQEMFSCDSDEREKDLLIIKELEEAGEDIVLPDYPERPCKMGDSSSSSFNLNIELDINKSESLSTAADSANCDGKSTLKTVSGFVTDHVNSADDMEDDPLSSDNSDLCAVYDEIGKFFKSAESRSEAASADLTPHTDANSDNFPSENMNSTIDIPIDWSENSDITDVSNSQILNTLHLLNASSDVLGSMAHEVSCLYDTARELNTQDVNLKHYLLHTDTRDLLMELQSHLKSAIAAGNMHMVKEAIYLEMMEMITNILE